MPQLLPALRQPLVLRRPQANGGGRGRGLARRSKKRMVRASAGIGAHSCGQAGLTLPLIEVRVRL